MENTLAVQLLTALAQESRLAVFRLLIEQGPNGMSAGKIAERLSIAPATLSFHLKELSHAGLVQARQESRFIFYSVNFPTINGLLNFLTENCCAGHDCDLPDSQCSPCSPSCAS